ncbi:transthyretin isoform X2 [Heterodontus francisci]|uniref:transthyretin isoform X2 n=1 Tax=Heterodontus francisci TaxID=7792 RepID=UPI00355B651D
MCLWRSCHLPGLQGSGISSGAHGRTDRKCPIIIKVLNAVNGTPAANLNLQIYKRNEDSSWQQLNTGVTTGMGDVHNLISEENFVAGLYKVHFNTGDYWRSLAFTPFHECVNVVFRVDGSNHHHYTLALLLSPYSYSTTGIVSDPH